MAGKLSVKHDDISGSEFEDLCMPGTTFTNINLGGAKFEDINLGKAEFHNINFSDGVFAGANIGGALFKHLGTMPDKDGNQERQRPVTFEEAMLCDSTFLRVDLSGVKIVECDLTGMTIDGILVTDLLKAWNHHKG
jgi:hypothetical protein